MNTEKHAGVDIRTLVQNLSKLGLQFLKKQKLVSCFIFNFEKLWICFLKVTEQGRENNVTILSIGRHGRIF
jgi:hypothetical protein